MALSVELRRLPVDLQDIQREIIRCRNDQHNSIYDLVLYWNRLQLHRKYWEKFGFKSEGDWIAFYLQDGVTLGRWTTMVELFDKATFTLVGPDTLWFMIQMVSQYQPGTERRKMDYQTIFDRYCSSRDAFHRPQFMALAREYVQKTYEVPAAEKLGKSVEEWRTQRYRRVVEITPPRPTPPAYTEPDATETSVPSVIDSARELQALRLYVAELEQIIVRELGESFLPPKPAILGN